MMYRRTKKSKNIQRHFQQRCMDRLGIYLNNKQIVNLIQKNQLDFVKRTSNTRTVFKYHCNVNNKDYKIVYDKLRHDVVTIFPYEKEVNKWQKNYTKI